MNIYAAGTGSYSDVTGQDRRCDGGNCTSNNPNRVTEGSNFFRICFQDVTGTGTLVCEQYSDSDDYKNKGSWNSTNNLKITDVNNSKIQYNSTGKEVNFTETNKNNFDFTDWSVFQNALTSNDFGSINFNSSNMSNFADIFNKSNFSGTEEQYGESIKNVINTLTNGNRDINSYLKNNTSINNLAMTVEIGQCWLLDGTEYCGTIDELLTVAKNVPYYKSVSYIDTDGKEREYYVKIESEKAYPNNIGNKKYLYGYACSGYLTGSIAEKINNNNFTSDTYFNGNLQIPSLSGTSCTNKYGSMNSTEFYEAYLKEGLGMAVIAFQEYFGDVKLTCDLINEITENTNTYYCDDENHVSNILKKFNTEENIANYGELTEEEYKSLCECEKKEEEKPGMCSTSKEVNQCSPGSNTVIYKDTTDYTDEYWDNCIINNSGYTDDYHKNSYIDYTLGDATYCPVYCVEELEATFGSNYITVNAGRYFNFDQLGTSEVIGKRVCRSKLNEKAIESALANVERNIVYAYRNLQQKEIENDSTPLGEWCDGVSVSTSLGYDPDCEYSIKEDGNVTTEIICQPKTLYSYTDENGTTFNNLTTCPINECSSISTFSKTKKVTTYSGMEYRLNRTWSSNNSKYIVRAGGNSTVCSTSFLSKTLSYYQQEYKAALAAYDALMSRLKECNNWSNDKIYNLTGDAFVTYESGNYNYKLSELTGILELDEVNTTYGEKADINFSKMNCDSSGCSKASISESIILYKSVEGQQSGTLTFNFNGGYHYISKGSNFSIVGSSNSEQEISFSHDFPISFNTTAGNYDITINYSNLGHNGAVSTVLKGYDNLGDWTCKYEVVDKLFKDGELQIIYRSIDLSKPFPDIDGTGRNSGSNWTISDIANVITNHQDIYSNKPMYTFILTPSMITKIRSYNKNNEYTDFNLSCTNGKNCISDFVTALIKQEYGVNDISDGACEVNRVNYPSSNFFDSCRYQKK